MACALSLLNEGREGKEQGKVWKQVTSTLKASDCLPQSASSGRENGHTEDVHLQASCWRHIFTQLATPTWKVRQPSHTNNLVKHGQSDCSFSANKRHVILSDWDVAYLLVLPSKKRKRTTTRKKLTCDSYTSNLFLFVVCTRALHYLKPSSEKPSPQNIIFDSNIGWEDSHFPFRMLWRFL